MDQADRAPSGTGSTHGSNLSMHAPATHPLPRAVLSCPPRGFFDPNRSWRFRIRKLLSGRASGGWRASISRRSPVTKPRKRLW